MTFLNEAAAADAAAFSALGESLTFSGSTFSGLVDRGIELVDDAGNVVERQTRITVRKTDADLNEGDTLTDGTNTFTVSAIVADDSTVQTVAVTVS